MSDELCGDDFEQRLLDHVELLYVVALKLTHNPLDAERITRSTMLKAWCRRNELEGKPGLKADLLGLLRHTFVNQRQPIGPCDPLPTVLLRPSKVAQGTRAGLPAQECSPAPRSFAGHAEELGLVAAL